MDKLISLLFVFSFVVLINAYCPSPRSLPSGICAKIYKHSKCEGISRSINSCEYTNLYSKKNLWNDIISSVVVRSKCILDVYEHTKFKGAHKTFTGVVTDLTRISHPTKRTWNDIISSWSCYCRRG